MIGSAKFSPCGRYRYRLARRWGAPPPLGFVMLNPSTADADVLDPTVRRCVGFAKREGAGGLLVCNASPFRGTNPRDLLGEELRVTHQDQVEALIALFRACPTVVVAWGAGLDTYFGERDRLSVPLIVNASLRRSGADSRVMRLGPTTSSGQPRHPLYLRADTPLVPHDLDRVPAAA